MLPYRRRRSELARTETLESEIAALAIKGESCQRSSGRNTAPYHRLMFTQTKG